MRLITASAESLKEIGCTVGNALRQFEQAGLLSRITTDQSKQSWFVIANAAIGLS